MDLPESSHPEFFYLTGVQAKVVRRGGLHAAEQTGISGYWEKKIQKCPQTLLCSRQRNKSYLGVCNAATRV